MARSSRSLGGFRTVNETFRGIRWRRQNRLWHEANKRTDPRFSAACKLDWTRALKRPDTRFDDGRQVAIVAREIGSYRVVYFLAYVKRHGMLNVISIRYAEAGEKNLFAHDYP